MPPATPFLCNGFITLFQVRQLTGNQFVLVDKVQGYVVKNVEIVQRSVPGNFLVKRGSLMFC